MTQKTRTSVFGLWLESIPCLRWLQSSKKERSGLESFRPEEHPSHSQYKKGPRPRALTIDNEKLSLEQSSLTQTQSALFNRLPYDVREQIYRHVFGHRNQHIPSTHFTRPLISMTCMDGDLPKPPELCTCLKHPYRTPYNGYMIYFDLNRGRLGDEGIKHTGISGAIALLQTCRMIYSEALPILYSTNTFLFYHIEHTNSLPVKNPEWPYVQQSTKSIVPHKLQFVRSIYIKWQVKYEFWRLAPYYQQPKKSLDGFRSACATLCSFRNLRKLRIDLEMQPWVITQSGQFLEALLDVEGCSDFQLFAIDCK
ncbi:hypothetical protein BT63DRAFT_200436 [Microthyrium microscopicum]|uniref:DUF7730 domain-containing protein n=1 Tax=Microthyrium microscopicum TaxID=703497 RepID=A0A6A6UEQ1_9PEZI|nr:hypothetical protein BT63DRAFT_200436 [Microthyrium microscopicum]